jgi:exonuclease SbcC
MRPELLELEGFGVFRDPTVIDFRDADLFALSGATGAGKSTVIDAIVFALYGVVPRYNDKKLVGVAISQGKVEAKVRLTFTVGDERYVVVRVVRFVGKAATTANTKEARLERVVGAPGRARDGDHDDDADAGEISTEVLAGTADEVTAAVERLLGLTYEHFTTCVVLPQGEFQRFLHAKPSERQQLLVELLDLGVYGAMGTLARGRAIAARDNRAWLDKQLEEVAGYTPLVRAEIEADIKTFEALKQRIDEVQPIVDELNQAAAAARAEIEVAEAALSALVGIEAPDDVASLAKLVLDATAAVDGARAAEDAAAESVARAQVALDQLPERALLDRARAVHGARTKEQHQIEKGEAAVTAARAEEVASRAALETATDVAVQAAAELEAARRANRADEFVRALAVGEECPICHQAVTSLPDHQATDVDRLVVAAREAEAARDAAATRLARAEAEKVRVADKLEDLLVRVAEHDAQLAEFPDLELLEEQIAAIDAAMAAMAHLVAVEKAAKRTRVGAERERTALEARSRTAWQSFDEVRDRLAAFGPPKPARADLQADWQALVDWADGERPGREEAAERARRAIDEAQRQASLHQTVLWQDAAAAGVEVDDAPVLRDAIIERLAEEKANLESVDAGIQRGADLRAEQAKVAEAEQVASVLGNHLKSTAFEKWVLDEVVHRLVAGATQILLELSGGAYSLTYDAKGFAVADHNNADLVRSARSLSGGETFLASLALALALADEVAQLAAMGTVRLESIFLDEGFGTLDPDTLDTVASAIEELGAGGRMVGLVTHVHDLAERLPTRFDVTKAGNASTITRIES